MKTKNKSKKGWLSMLSLNRLIMILLFVSALISTVGNAPLQAQEDQPITYSRPSWYFGIAAGGNFNFYRGTTQRLNDDLMVPKAFRHGDGLGLYIAPLIEYHKSDRSLGFMLQASYDSREGSFDQVITACNCPADLSTDLSYYSIEPSIRFAPFKSDFYLYAGPRFAFNKSKSFTYQLGLNPDILNQESTPAVSGEFSSVEDMLISMQVGIGYDIPLSSDLRKTQFVISPFVAYHFQFGEDPRSIETWHVSTVRAGVALKFGRGKEQKVEEIAEPVIVPIAPLPAVKFTVYSPANIPVERRVRETFPILNYVFFDLGSTKIPDRYVLITKDKVEDFKEEQLEVLTPKRLADQTSREMVVYYNVLNILGDRMNDNPETSIKLIGSSEQGTSDARAMAESVKNYLVTVFSINSSRISIEGRNAPKIPGIQPGATKELTQLRQGDRRVSIESSSPKILMQFQSGPDVPMKPVEVDVLEDAPIDSYVSFLVSNATKSLSSWSLEVEDNKGQVQKFGPYNEEAVNLPSRTVLGVKNNGEYKMTMVGITKDGTEVRSDTTVRMALWVPAEDEQGMRFSIVYGFNDSNSIMIYKDYLTNVVAPKIPNGASVILQGYTDKIGNAQHNKELSLARANDVLDLLKNAVSKLGKRNITYRVLGLGEEVGMPFGNTLPEQRFYNRTVIIDIIPEK